MDNRNIEFVPPKGCIAFRCAPVNTPVGYDFRVMHKNSGSHVMIDTSLYDCRFPTFKLIKDCKNKREFYRQFESLGVIRKKLKRGGYKDFEQMVLKYVSHFQVESPEYNNYNPVDLDWEEGQPSLF